MKKWLSILGTIVLATTSTTTLISCEKPNNNENGGGNKPEPNKPQQPPENSNWKLIDSALNKKREEFKNINNKYYIIIYKLGKNYRVEKFNFNRDILAFEDTIYVNNVYFGLANMNIYRWDGLNEPKLPEIDNNGKITNWKE